jgi:hypothetical protein
MHKSVILLGLLAAACAAPQRPAPNPKYYEAYYDGYYGVVLDGYWGRDPRYFWYLDKNKLWHRDTRHHFQRAEGGAKYTYFRGLGGPREH